MPDNTLVSTSDWLRKQKCVGRGIKTIQVQISPRKLFFPFIFFAFLFRLSSV